MSRVVIIGNGIAGITAARHIRKLSDTEILIISGESDYFFSRTALMYIYMGHMKFEHTKPYEDWFWKKNKIELMKAWVNTINSDSKTIITDNGEEIGYDHLILALGSKSNKFGWPGQDLKGVSGLYSLQDLEYIEENTNLVTKAVIVGGGLIGIELAEMLHARNIHVTFLVREKHFWDVVLPHEESLMIENEIKNHGIDLRLETELKEIVSDENGKVKSVITINGDEIEAQFVGLTVGVTANIALAKSAGLETNRGILVNEYLETTIPDIYAIGDCVELRQPATGRRAIEQVWYTGRKMGETVAQSITGHRSKYEPGIWFNSAKFFNIEYQTYGQVAANLISGKETFYWQSSDMSKMLRIIIDEKKTHVIGVNVLGIRMRHEVWDRWIRERRKLSEVMTDLEKVNFDPEFFKRYEDEIRAAYNIQFPYMAIEIKPKSFFQRIFA